MIMVKIQIYQCFISNHKCTVTKKVRFIASILTTTPYNILSLELSMTNYACE